MTRELQNWDVYLDQNIKIPYVILKLENSEWGKLWLDGSKRYKHSWYPTDWITQDSVYIGNISDLIKEFGDKLKP